MARKHRMAGSVAIALVTLALLACSPMGSFVEPTPTALPTPTSTPLPSATPLPSPTLAPTATPIPTATRAPTAASTPTPSGISPVSKYSGVISGRAGAGGGIFVLQRAEFWEELTLVKPRNGMFIVFVGTLAGEGGQATCPTASDFELAMDGRRHETSSQLMDPFKMLYQVDYPGSIRGQCVTRAAPTFLVFDTPLPRGTAQLAFRGANINLGDFAGVLRKSGYPLPGTENLLRQALAKLLPPTARVQSRLLDVKVSDAPQGAKIVGASWVLENTQNIATDRETLKNEATSLLRAIYTTEGLKVSNAEVAAAYRTFDVLGNPSDAVVARLTLDAATAAKINWQNFLPANLFAVVKVVALDPRFR